jgi:small-conductance mechanosensitive channel
MTLSVENIAELLRGAAIVTGSALIGLFFHYLVFNGIMRVISLTFPHWPESQGRQTKSISRLIFVLFAIYIALSFVEMPDSAHKIVNGVYSIVLIIAIAWFLVKLISVFETVILMRYRLEDKDNLQARKIYTQMTIVRSILIFVIAVVAFSAILMSFERFRRLGTAILASAGVVGIVVGFAAQRILGNLLAGIQIALTQPLRLDDVVIVENEWGRIEEITLTYVVVRIWDLRRLVLPLSYFIEKPFQDWTRTSADLIGSVYLYVDYTVPVQEIREEVLRILKNSTWDGKVWGLQVTDATEHSMQVRAIMSAPDSSSAWDLKCEVREKLIDFMRTKHSEAITAGQKTGQNQRSRFGSDRAEDAGERRVPCTQEKGGPAALW